MEVWLLILAELASSAANGPSQTAQNLAALNTHSNLAIELAVRVGDIQLATSLEAHARRVASLITALSGALVAQRVVLIQAKKTIESNSEEFTDWIADDELDALAGTALKLAQDTIKRKMRSQL